MATEAGIAPYCIYTLLHTDRLQEIANKGGIGSAHEKKRWRMGETLFRQATAQGRSMVILFGLAEGNTGVVYQAALTGINLDEIGTAYTFTGLKPLPEKQPLRSLRLKRSGKLLSDNYIRPYAICETPSFLVMPLTTSSGSGLTDC